MKKLFLSLLLLGSLNITQAQVQKNETILQGFEWETKRTPPLWCIYAAQAKEWADAGFTMIWIPPPYKGGSGIWSVGYDPYDYYDLGEFNQRDTIRTKYGTRAELQAGVAALKENNIRVIIDAVINHKSMGDKEEHFIYPDGSEATVKTLFDLSARNGNYSSYIWNGKSFDGYQTGERDHEHGVLLPGKEWDKSFESDYLSGADIDYQNQEVREEMVKWGVWITKTLDTDGFRIDAVKHIDTDFIKYWADEVRRQTGKDLFIVGEAWFENKTMLSRYMDETSNKIRLFDFNLYREFTTYKNTHSIQRVVTGGFEVTDKSREPVTFVNNHDTLRPSERRAGVIENSLFFYAYILIKEGGVPCVFLQDYRRLGDALRPLLAARRDYAYGDGELQQADKFSCCYVRKGTDDTNGAILLYHSQKNTTMKVKFRPGAVLHDITGNVSRKVKINDAGYGTFHVKKDTVSVWVPELK